MASATQSELFSQAAELPRTLPNQAQQFDGQQGGSLARRRYQDGSLFVRGKRKPKWIGRYREDFIGSDGKVRRVRHSVVLGTKSDLTQKLAQRLLDQTLERINGPEYRPSK